MRRVRDFPGVMVSCSSERDVEYQCKCKYRASEFGHGRKQLSQIGAPGQKVLACFLRRIDRCYKTEHNA
jgi:hypothetical protein